jgi:hypothetical protein
MSGHPHPGSTQNGMTKRKPTMKSRDANCFCQKSFFHPCVVYPPTRTRGNPARESRLSPISFRPRRPLLSPSIHAGAALSSLLTILRSQARARQRRRAGAQTNGDGGSGLASLRSPRTRDAEAPSVYDDEELQEGEERPKCKRRRARACGQAGNESLFLSLSTPIPISTSRRRHCCLLLTLASRGHQHLLPPVSCPSS